MTTAQKNLRYRLEHPTTTLFRKRDGKSMLVFPDDITNEGAWAHTSLGERVFLMFDEILTDFQEFPVK